MSPSTNRPSRAIVERARDELLEHARATGTRPSVLDLARRVGLANTTLRRNYPDIAQTITAARAACPTSRPDPKHPTQHDRLAARNAKLRRVNRELTQMLRVAMAQIQRLATSNHHLQHELQVASGVIQLDARRPIVTLTAEEAGPAPE